jgi:hypothetical protein
MTPRPGAAAGLIEATDPERIADITSDLGYGARLEADAVGDPLIRTHASGADFSVFFYGCTDTARCKAAQFQAGFDLSAATSAAKMNEWNRAHRFGTAFIDDERDQSLQMDVTPAGGVSRTNCANAVDWWKVAPSEYQDFFGW